MRILVIDDEADQASVNTRKMNETLDEEDLERTAVNQLIIDLVNGRNADGSKTTAPFQAMNYISFTATPCQIRSENHEQCSDCKVYRHILKTNYGVSYGSVTLKSLQNDNIPELDLLVRESIQNSSDAALNLPGQSYCVNFTTGTFIPKDFNGFLTGIEAELNSRYTAPSADFYTISRRTIKRIQVVRSDEIELMQIVDIMVGAVSYKLRGYNTSIAKGNVINLIERRSGYKMERNSLYRENKFNIFHLQLREVGD